MKGPLLPEPDNYSWLWWHLTALHGADVPLTDPPGMTERHARLHRVGADHAHRALGRRGALGPRQASLLATIEANPGRSKSEILRLDDKGVSKQVVLNARHAVLDQLLNDSLIRNASTMKRRFELHITDEGLRLLKRERVLGSH